MGRGWVGGGEGTFGGPGGGGAQMTVQYKIYCLVYVRSADFLARMFFI